MRASGARQNVSGYGYDQYDEPPVPAKPVRKQRQKRSEGGAWRVVLQFIVGLAVIAGVAFAIVALYIRYYQ